MCLAALALDAHQRFPLVLAANRDEFFERPSARLSWWKSCAGGPEILSGRDLKAGGTWLGLTVSGRLGLLTNVRAPQRVDESAPSRGLIVPAWLQTHLTPDRFWAQTALSGYNDFNVFLADFFHGDCWWASNRVASPRRLERGIYGLSNASLDTPWPKVQQLKTRLGDALRASSSTEELVKLLFTALGNRALASDDELPSTGIPLALERALSPAFIRTADGKYGTRCSTVIVTERTRRRLITHVFERTYGSPQSGVALLRSAVLQSWPPRYTQSMQHPEDRLGSESMPVGEVELPQGDPPSPAGGAIRPIKPRARTLIKPARPKSAPSRR